MDRELEIAAVASAGGWAGHAEHDTLPVGTPCPNCSTPLMGPYCHACGQLGEQFNRSVRTLVVEAVENFFHVDGRLFNTLPTLLRNPAKLTRDYVDGHRAAQIPPLRLFLVVMLIFFFVGGLNAGHTNIRVATIDDVRDPQVAHALKAHPANQSAFMQRWVEPRLRYAGAHPREFSMTIGEWTHRIAIAMLPVAALLLSLLYAFQRRFFVFDHVIFSMHSLSFMGLLASVQAAIGSIPGVGDWSLPLLLAAPVHLFLHMRGFYASSIVGTLLRMAVLFVGSLAALGALLVAVTFISLNELELDKSGPATPAVSTAVVSHGASSS